MSALTRTACGGVLIAGLMLLFVTNPTVRSQNPTQNNNAQDQDDDEQKIASFGAEETPFAAAILLDTSGSMESRLTLGRSAAIRFLDGLRDEDVAAVYNFDAKVEQMQEFSPGRDLPARAFGVHTKMMTALNDAVLRA